MPNTKLAMLLKWLHDTVVEIYPNPRICPKELEEEACIQ